MGDEFDGCECIWSHELAMQRLLAFIRQNQDHCSDTDCIDVSGRLQHQQASRDGGSDNNFVMITMLIIFAVIFAVLRPPIMKLTNRKPRQGGGPQDDLPPAPPAPPAVN